MTSPTMLANLVRWRLRATGLRGARLSMEEVAVDIAVGPVFDPANVVASCGAPVGGLWSVIDVPMMAACDAVRRGVAHAR